jgi:hypothetical protein
VEDQEGVIQGDTFLSGTNHHQVGVLQEVVTQETVAQAVHPTTKMTTFETAAGTSTAAKRLTRSSSHPSPLADSGGSGVGRQSKPSSRPLVGTTTRPWRGSEKSKLILPSPLRSQEMVGFP